METELGEPANAEKTSEILDNSFFNTPHEDSDEKMENDLTTDTIFESETDNGDNLSSLEALDIENAVRILQKRTKRKEIFTAFANTLISVNPHERTDVYSKKFADFHTSKVENLEQFALPHPFATAMRAYKRLRFSREEVLHPNQIIVVTGEPGSGKTLVATQVENYLVTYAPLISENDKIREKLLHASAILNAFGNAANEHSVDHSCMGKFTKLLYAVKGDSAHVRAGTLVGGVIQTYLLETSRLVSQGAGERNFNVFYFLKKGSKSRGLSRYRLTKKDLSGYGYTKVSKQLKDDGKGFKDLKTALDFFLVPEEEQTGIWRILGGILNLGSVKFGLGAKGNSKISDEKSHHAESFLEDAAKALGVNVTDLRSVLVRKYIRTKDREPAEVPIVFKYAESLRDELTKFLYNKLFQHLLKMINSKLTERMPQNVCDFKWIGILRGFEFQNFSVNKLHQFLNNYANEKMHNTFIESVMLNEKFVRGLEGTEIQWNASLPLENRSLLTLYEKTNSGFFPILKNASKAGWDVEAREFKELFCEGNENSSLIEKPSYVNREAGENPLIVKHFKGTVTYNLDAFVRTDRNRVSEDKIELLQSSSLELIKEITKADVQKISTAEAFRKKFKNLLSTFKESEAQYICCVDPNGEAKPNVFTAEFAKEQLVRAGFDTCFKLLKPNFPTSWKYEDIYNTYSHIDLGPEINERLKKNDQLVHNPGFKNRVAREFTEVLLILASKKDMHGETIDFKDCQMGVTKVFFPVGKKTDFEETLKDLEAMAEPISNNGVRSVMDLLAGKTQQKVFGCLKFLLWYKKREKDLKVYDLWEETGRQVGRIASFVGQLEKIRKRKAYVVIQSYYEAWQARQKNTEIYRLNENVRRYHVARTPSTRKRGAAFHLAQESVRANIRNQNRKRIER